MVGKITTELNQHGFDTLFRKRTVESSQRLNLNLLDWIGLDCAGLTNKMSTPSEVMCLVQVL